MAEPIFDPEYWRNRLQVASELHHAIFLTHLPIWQRIEQRHRELLIKFVRPDTSILDIGCGWGRLLDLLPSDWYGKYIGIDLCTEFIELAKKTYPKKNFYVCDIRNITTFLKSRFDLGILISIKGMVINNMGTEEWEKIQTKLCKVVDNLLVLEYTEQDEGELIKC